MLSDESAGKAGPPSGPKRSHLAPTSLSWTWLYIHHLQIIWSPITSHHITRSIVFALAWSGEVVAAASFSGWRDQSEACLCSVTKSRQTICPGRKIMWKCFFFFCCHSVAFSRELFSKICFDIFVKLEMSKLALCILYMLQQLPIQLHNASK